jgi:predicted RND superfamily exporter protein
MGVIDRAASVVAHRSRYVVAAMLLLTLAVGAGAGMVEQSSTMNALATDSPAIEKNEYVDANFSARGENTTTTLIAVRTPDGNVLSKDELVRSLELQRALRANATLNATLVDERPTTGIANLVARSVLAAEGPVADGHAGAADRAETGAPSLDRQIAALDAANASAVRRTVDRLLAPDSDLPGSRAATRLLPRSYEPGSPTANATLVVLTQRTEQPVRVGAALSQRVVDGQVAARAIATDHAGEGVETLAFGRGLLTQQQNQAIGDSLGLLGPVALLFVLAALSVAYRDPVDVVLGLVGVVLVLVWTFGAMGWAGIEFNQMMIAVPLLLIGLAVDYALHVVMRYREERAERAAGREASAADSDAGGPAVVRAAMTRSLAGVGGALVLVTLTTAVGFLANLTSPVPDIRTFGVVTAVGIVSTLAVFGLLLPALKVETDAALEKRGVDRALRPFGTGGYLGRALSGGATLAKRAPLLVLVVALVASAATAAGAAEIDGEYSPETFMADDPPGWTEAAPAAVEPGEYYLVDSREYVYAHFQSPDKQVSILVEGDVTAPDTLERVADARAAAANASGAFTRSSDGTVATPLTAMRATAARNESFNATLAAADANGDGVPDRDLAALYDAFDAAAPDAADRLLHSADGEYVALRLRVPIVGTADHDAVRDDLSAVATGIERGETSTAGTAEPGENSTLTATATGGPVVQTAVADSLVSTIFESLAVTLAVLVVLLAVAFRIREGSAELGALTVVPVLFAVSWLLWTMTALDIPFTLVSALVGSISLGLGVDYAIHVTERFGHELDAGRTPEVALERTVVGTGGALLSSAVTTAAGFGVLAFSLLPALAQFGLVLAVGIGYAFVASVFVLPSLLALWARYGSPAPTVTGDANAVASDD